MPPTLVPKLLFFPINSESGVTAAQVAFSSGLTKIFEALSILSGTIRMVEHDGQKGRYCVSGPWRLAPNRLCINDLSHLQNLDYVELRKKGFPMELLQSRDLLPLAEMGAQDKAVMVAQMNVIRGDIILTLCLHHVFTDGNGTFAIAKVWAAYCRGEDGSELISDGMLDGDHMAPASSEKARLDEFPQFSGSPAADTPEQRDQKMGEIEGNIFFFPFGKLTALKRLASGPEDTKDKTGWTSTNDALWALQMCCIYSTSDLTSEQPANEFNEEQTVGMSLVMNLRPNLNPPLAPDYLGNPLTMIQIIMPHKSITATVDKQAEIVRLVRRQIRQVDDSDVRRLTSALQSIPDLEQVRGLASKRDQELIRISSWATQDFYGLEWGGAVEAKVERVRLPICAPWNTIIVMPRLKARFDESERGLEVGIWIRKEEIEKLKQNAFFGQFAQWRCR